MFVFFCFSFCEFWSFSHKILDRDSDKTSRSSFVLRGNWGKVRLADPIQNNSWLGWCVGHQKIENLQQTSPAQNNNPQSSRNTLPISLRFAFMTRLFCLNPSTTKKPRNLYLCLGSSFSGCSKALSKEITCYLALAGGCGILDVMDLLHHVVSRMSAPI